MDFFGMALFLCHNLAALGLWGNLFQVSLCQLWIQFSVKSCTNFYCLHVIFTTELLCLKFLAHLKLGLWIIKGYLMWLLETSRTDSNHTSLVKWFSNLSVYQKSLEGLEHRSRCFTFRVSDSVVVEEGLTICTLPGPQVLLILLL